MKSVFLAEFSVKGSPQFHDLIKLFCSAYQQKLKKLIDEENSYFSKLKESGLNLEQIVTVSLLIGLLLFHRLGNEPKKSFRPVITEQPFAMITGNLRVRPKLARQQSSIASFTQTRATPDEQSDITLAQKQPTQLVISPRTVPRNVNLVAQRSKKSPVDLYKRSPVIPVISDSQSSTNLNELSQSLLELPQSDSALDEIFVSNTETVEFLVDADFEEFDRLENILSERFPKSRVRIQPTYNYINDKWVLSKEVSVATSRFQHDVGREFKVELKKEIKKNNIFAVFDFEKEFKFERDHTSNTVIRQLTNLTDNEASSVLITKDIHKFLTDNRKYNVKKGLGYTAGKGGMMTLLDSFKKQDENLLIKYGNTEKGFQAIHAAGTNIDDLLEAYNESHDIDQQTISAIVKEKDVSDNVLLAVRQDMLLNKLTAQDFSTFVERFSKRHDYDLEKAGTYLNQLTTKAQERREHTHAVRQIVDPKSKTFFDFRMAEKKVLSAAIQAYDYVEARGVIPHKGIKNLYLSEIDTKRGMVLTPGEAYDQAYQRLQLNNFKQVPESLLPNKTFTKNLKR